MEEVKYSICVSALQKKYKDKEVLSNVTFSVPKGTIYTLLGSNGAGKTTLLSILSAQNPATEGNVTWKNYVTYQSQRKRLIIC